MILHISYACLPRNIARVIVNGKDERRKLRKIFNKLDQSECEFDQDNLEIIIDDLHMIIQPARFDNKYEDVYIKKEGSFIFISSGVIYDYMKSIISGDILVFPRINV